MLIKVVFNLIREGRFSFIFLESGFWFPLPKPIGRLAWKGPGAEKRKGRELPSKSNKGEDR